MLRSKEAQSLTQKALDDVVEGSTSLVRNTVELIKLGVQNRLDSAGIDFKAVPGLSELFAEDHQISHLVPDLGSGGLGLAICEHHNITICVLNLKTREKV